MNNYHIKKKNRTNGTCWYGNLEGGVSFNPGEIKEGFVEFHVHPNKWDGSHSSNG